MIESTTERGNGSGRSFRRAGAGIAIACAVGALIGVGTSGAYAASPLDRHPSVATQHAAASPTPKTTYSAADLRAFSRSAYAKDALNLAVVWGTPDLITAKGKAGAALREGRALPFTPAKATRLDYSIEQQASAFYLAQSDYGQALGLATVWGSPNLSSAKAKIGALRLQHQELPKARDLTASQQVMAFHLAGYTDTDGLQLATLWNTDTVRIAEIRAGKTLLLDGELPTLS